MLLNDLALNLAREVSLFGDGLGLSIVTFLHKVVDLDVVFHREKFYELAVDTLTFVRLCHIVDAFLTWSLLYLNVNDGSIGRGIPVHRDLVFEVVNGELR